MKIPFCLPVIDQDVIDEMNDTLTNTGWLTSGPKVFALEKEVSKLTNSECAICVNSWTSGAMLILRWFGVGTGDEVIIPSYTYSATALAVLNMGAIPVMVDVNEDFTINPLKVEEKITEKTKAIIPVDIAGYPCDYDILKNVIINKGFLFNAKTKNQKKLNRILILADAAHSIGAEYKGKAIGSIADFTVFSMHSVKNITTGEGGAITMNLPECFSSEEEYKFLKALSLNGQNKSALEKNQPGAWKYDIIDQGLKVNMPDVCAAIGLAQIRKYKDCFLPERKAIFNYYDIAFSNLDWAVTPKWRTENAESSCHLYLLRVKGINESQRDEMILRIGQKGVGVNVHYIPMPMLALFKNLGYKMEDYPVTYDLYANEISLPVYNNLTKEELEYVVDSVILSYNETVNP